MRRLLLAGAAVLALGASALLWSTAPERADPAVLEGIAPDPERGAQLFLAAGCASCHAAPDAPPGTRPVLAGGRRLASPFGTFVAPNISPDPQAGIGTWQPIDLFNALKYGTSPEGRHYYPAFPYTSYRHMSPADVVSLFAYLRSLPPDPTPNRPHELPFPFSVRAGLGLWKALFLRGGWVLRDPPDAAAERGRYLVEALGHCGECHTPRNALGGLRRRLWLAGAENPAGAGWVPNITPARLHWSEADLLGYFTTGFTPDYDTVGGSMAEVVENLSRLPEDELRAIIAYLRAVPAVAPTKRQKE